MNSRAKILCYFSVLFLSVLSTKAEERILIAADNQVIEINRAGKVLDIIKFPGQDGVYDAWRLPDGGIVYIHRLGLTLLDANKKVVMEHKAVVGAKGAEINSVDVLEGGAKFAVMESGINKILIIDRKDRVSDSISLPDLSDQDIHFRYRMIRKVNGEEAFFVAQKGSKTLIKVDMKTGNILKSLPLDPYLKPSAVTHKGYAAILANDGSKFTSTSDGCQIIHIGANDKLLSCWTKEDLGLSCRYFTGLQLLKNGNIMAACSDFHVRTAEENSDVLAEITPAGKVIWKLTRAQLVNQIEGYIDPDSGMEELRLANIHIYDTEHIDDCLKVKR